MPQFRLWVGQHDSQAQSWQVQPARDRPGNLESLALESRLMLQVIVLSALLVLQKVHIDSRH